MAKEKCNTPFDVGTGDSFSTPLVKWSSKAGSCTCHCVFLLLNTLFLLSPQPARLVQKAELTRLAQTFLHVPRLHWIVVEDSEQPTALVRNLLAESGLTYTQLHVLTPKDKKLQEGDPSWLKPRGAEQRNEGVRWLREMASNSRGQHGAAVENGVVYFADDDNTYSVKLFEEVNYDFILTTRCACYACVND